MSSRVSLQAGEAHVWVFLCLAVKMSAQVKQAVLEVEEYIRRENWPAIPHDIMKVHLEGLRFRGLALIVHMEQCPSLLSRVGSGRRLVSKLGSSPEYSYGT